MWGSFLVVRDACYVSRPTYTWLKSFGCKKHVKPDRCCEAKRLRERERELGEQRVYFHIAIAPGIMTTAVPGWKLQLLQRKKEKEAEDEKRRKEEEEKAAKMTAWGRGKKPLPINNAASRTHGPAKSDPTSSRQEVALNRTNASQSSAGTPRKGSLTKRSKSGTLESVEEKTSPSPQRAHPSPAKAGDAAANSSPNVFRRPRAQALQPGKMQAPGASGGGSSPRPSSLDFLSRSSAGDLHSPSKSPRKAAAQGLSALPKLEFKQASLNDGATLTCTLVDDVKVSEDDLRQRGFTVPGDYANRGRVVQSEPTTPQGGSPRLGRRRRSCISIPGQDKRVSLLRTKHRNDALRLLGLPYLI